MLSLKQNFNIPKSWDEISVEQFIELNTMVLGEFGSVSSIQLERLAIITETSSDDEIWEELDTRMLNKMIKDAFFLAKNPSTNYKKKLFDDKFIAKTFNSLTIGEFIDIEYYLEQGNVKNIAKIASILYRKYKTGEWGETIIEPYEVIDLEEREKIFLDIPITDIYGIVVAYITFKNDFLKKYEALFEPEFDFDPEDDQQEDEVASYEAEQEKIAEEKIKKWSWERLLFNIAKGDPIKLLKVTELGLVYVFNILSMKQELNIE